MGPVTTLNRMPLDGQAHRMPQAPLSGPSTIERQGQEGTSGSAIYCGATELWPRGCRLHLAERARYVERLRIRDEICSTVRVHPPVGIAKIIF
jgi:hypothetical protein